MPIIITAPCAKLMMRSTPKIRLSPLTTAWSRSPQVTPWPRRAARLPLPLGHGEDRLGLGVLGGADDDRLTVLHLDQGRRRADALARFVETDRLLGQDVIGQVGPGDRVTQLVAVHRAGALERV